MKSLFLILLVIFGLSSFGQAKAGPPDPVEIKMTRKAIMEVKNIRDIIKGIPAGCKIVVSYVTSSKKAGILKRGAFTGVDDIQKQIPTKECDVIFMLLTSYCKETHKPEYKIIII